MKKYGYKKIFIFYLILSFLPLQLSGIIFDGLILLQNKKPGTVITNLTMKELADF